MKQTDAVRSFIDAINRQNNRECASLMTEDHTFIDSRGRVIAGREVVIAGWMQYFRMFPDYQIRDESMIHCGAMVAVFGSTRGTFHGKRGLVPANRVEMPSAWRVVVENGLVKEWQVYADWSEGTKIMAQDDASDELD